MPESSRFFLEFRDFSLSLNGDLVLDQINFTLDEKKLLALIGPKGSGKSLLLQSINRLFSDNIGVKTQGQIFVDGKSLFRSDIDLMKLRRQVGMVFPEPSLFPNMTVFENLALGLRLQGFRSGAQIHEKIEDTLRFLGLWAESKDIVNKYPKVLPLGLQQKLAVARSVVLKPKLLLLDEPTTFLNTQETQEFESLLRRVNGRLTMIFSTRRRKQAARFSDRTAFLLEGELVEIGKTSDLYMNPSDQRTEEYLTGRFGQ